jgi:hypothetical protein
MKDVDRKTTTPNRPPHQHNARSKLMRDECVRGGLLSADLEEIHHHGIGAQREM